MQPMQTKLTCGSERQKYRDDGGTWRQAVKYKTE